MSDYSSKGGKWEAIRQTVLRNADHMCMNMCGNEATHVDHIMPKVLGGTDELSNLQALCATCNTRKGARVQAERKTWHNPRWI